MAQGKMRPRRIHSARLLSILLGTMIGRVCSFVTAPQRAREISAMNHHGATNSLLSRYYASSTALPASVTGTIYRASDDDNAPTVILFTKEGCTLCDKVKDVLVNVQDNHPHSLDAVDITDEDKTDILERYKYDIPVLHVNGHYWTKHRITTEEAVEGLTAARDGSFTSQPGEPDAGAMERKQAERQQN